MLTNSITNDLKHHFRYGNMVMKLIFVNGGVFVFFGLFYLLSFLIQNNSAYQFLLIKLEMPASLNTLLYQPWSLLSYMFLHTGLFHFVFNMLWLYWFGEIFVMYLGDKKVLPLYLLGGIAGAAVYVLAYNLLPAFKPVVNVSLMLGASASIFAIVFAAATLAPDYEIKLAILGVIRIKYVALFSLLLDIINIPYGNAGGYIAHIGGALCGFLYIKSLQGGFDWSSPFNKIFDSTASLVKPKSNVRVAYKNTDYKKTTISKIGKSEQARVDEILDKIARSGYDSLTKEEKDFLFNYSKK